MSKNQNDDNDYLRLFSIVYFAVESDSGVKWSPKMGPEVKKDDLRLSSIVMFVVESDSGVKWSLKMGPGAKKEDFEAQK